MARYIDAELIPYVESENGVLDDYAYRYDINEIPTADVEEVVRCRKCKYHHWKQEPCHGKTEHFCSRLNTQVFADFHCGYGERSNT